MLEADIRDALAHKDILLMAHIVLGYPSLSASKQIAQRMVEAGVDLIELQIPFSEPSADGPVILRANQRALAGGVTVDDCLEVASQLAHELPIPIVFMSYYNIVFVRGVERFASEVRAAGLRGAIIPDLPFEEGEPLLAAFREQQLAPVFIYSPTTSDARMQAIAQRAEGFVYCVARRGVTGSRTDFAALGEYMARCRRATRLPLALGFGVSNREDVAAITGKVDIAVVGSETIRVVEREGAGAVGPFLRGLR